MLTIILILACVIIVGFVFDLLTEIKNSINTTMAKVSELESVLTPINAALSQAATDISAAVAALQGQINNSSDPELPAGAQTQIDTLNATAARLAAIAPSTPAV